MSKILAILKIHPDYIDFSIPELNSLLQLHGQNLKEVYKYEFTEQEFPKNSYEIQRHAFKNFPFVQVNLQDTELFNKICNRAINIEGFVEVLAEGNNYEDLYQNAKVNFDKIKHYTQDEQQEICVRLDAIYAKVDQSDKVKKIDQVVNQLQIKGKINLESPTRTYVILEHHVSKSNLQCKKDVQQEAIQTLKRVYFGVRLIATKNKKSGQGAGFQYKYDLADRIYMGPTCTENTLAFLMANQAQVREKDLILDPFLGTGSLLVPPSHFGAICFGQDIEYRVLHGTGVGRINKKSNYYKEHVEYVENYHPKIHLNFIQYGFPIPCIHRMDTVTNLYHHKEFFDAIVCDPPYGRSAASKTIGKWEKKEKDIGGKKQDTEEQKQVDSEYLQQDKLAENIDLKKNKEKKDKIAEENKQEIAEQLQQETIKTNDNQENQVQSKKIIQTKNTHPETVIEGLLKLADYCLKVGGLLVFLYPVEREFYKGQASDLPKHEHFELQSFSENTLTSRYSRILVTMKKIK